MTNKPTASIPLARLGGLLVAIILGLAATTGRAANLRWDTSIAADATITDGAGGWTNGAGNWNNGATSSGINYADGDNVYFGGGTAGAAGTITIAAGGVSPGGIGITNANGGGMYTFSGGPINMTGGGITNLTPATTMTYNVPVNGSFAMGTVGNFPFNNFQADGNQTAANTVTIRQQTFFGNGGAAGGVGSAVIDNEAFAFVYSHSVNRGISNAISGGGNLQLSPRGSTTLTVYSNLTHTGTTRIASGGSTGGTTAGIPTVAMGGANVLSAASDFSMVVSTAPTTITNVLDLAGFSQTMSSLLATNGVGPANCIITSSTGTATLTLGGGAARRAFTMACCPGR